VDVDLDEMRAGADRSYSASDFAADAVERLARGRFSSGIFGAFGAAESFHTTVGEAHSNHLRRMDAHQSNLGALGDKAHRTASAFRDMEDRNTAALRSVPWPITPA
jgi:hypothetical protein